MTVFGREPSAWIGLAVALVVAVLGVLTGQGFISDAAAGKVTDAANAIAQLLTLIAPLAAGLLIRQQVTPLSQPSLPLGTDVLIRGTADTPPGNAVVVRK